MMLAGLAACGGAAQPQVVEKVVTVEVEKEVEKVVTVEVQTEVEKIVTVEVEKEVEKIVTVEVMQEAAAGGSAARAVEAAKQYAGTTLNVTWEAGLQAQDPLLFSGPEWERLTGIKINVVEVPFPELYSKAVAEHLAGSGAYDVLNYSPAWTGDLADTGALEPLDSYIDQYMDKKDLEDINPIYRPFQSWKGQTYGLFDDGDVFVMYYRKDWFEDEQNQADFKKQFNRDLAPPKTWQEWDEVCQFFTEKLSADGSYGCGIQRAEGQAYLWFMDHFRGNGGKFFDDTMKAAINNEAGVQTLTEMVNSNKFMPPGIEKWGFVEILSAWLDGKLGMIITWPPIGRWSEGYGTQTAQLSWVPKTQVAGKVGYAIPPGGHPELAGGFNLGVSTDSKNKEAAYLFIQWLNSPEISNQRVKLPFALRDPYRLSHYEDILYQNLWPAAPDYLKVLKEGADVGVSDLGIPGAREYEEALDRAVTAAYAGTDPQEALDTAAGEWDAITDRIGADVQKAALDEWIKNLGKNAYPE
ncbi:MAG: sugar ABC transporter substrate-binding protein [Chloroflexi bacterium]|nr:sugar ABC transporter substrate-binding protein [Chloroflexota bacterium]